MKTKNTQQVEKEKKDEEKKGKQWDIVNSWLSAMGKDGSFGDEEGVR